MSADKLASFRVDSQLWEQFQSHAKENNVTATALLISYIKSVIHTSNVITSNPVVSTSSEVNNPTLSIQDIDQRIDDKIKSSIQDVKPSIQNIEDLIDARIGGSIAEGDIRDAIASSYAAVMGNFNGLVEELQELKKQMEVLESVPPAAVPNPPIIEELTTNNEQLTTDNEQFTEDVESDRTDSDLTPDTQPIWDSKLMKNPVDSVRKQLKKLHITKTAEEIKKAFLDAGFDGANHQSLRDDVINSLSQE